MGKKAPGAIQVMPAVVCVCIVESMNNGNIAGERLMWIS